MPSKPLRSHSSISFDVRLVVRLWLLPFSMPHLSECSPELVKSHISLVIVWLAPECVIDEAVDTLGSSELVLYTEFNRMQDVQDMGRPRVVLSHSS